MLLRNNCNFIYTDKELSIFRRHSSNTSTVNNANADWENIIKKYNSVNNISYHAIWYLIYNIKNYQYLWYLTKKKLSSKFTSNEF